MFSAICYCEDIESDVDQALGVVPKEPKWPNGIALYDVQDAANSFVNQHRSVSAVEFLQTKLDDPNSREQTLLFFRRMRRAVTRGGVTRSGPCWQRGRLDIGQRLSPRRR